MKPRLLDLFCGAGGAAMGYHRAGLDVIGVDIEPQPDYPFEFIRADAIDVLLGLVDFANPLRSGRSLDRPGWNPLGRDPGPMSWTLDDFDAVHASPPCPTHSTLNGWSGVSESPDLIPQTRAALIASGVPYVIENVEGAPLLNPVRICGQALGLKVRRHRLFECSFPVMVPPCWHPGPPVIVVGGSIGRKVFDPRRKAIAPTFEEAKDVMGMPWATTRQGVVNAIPPAYTEHVGRFLLDEVKR